MVWFNQIHLMEFASVVLHFQTEGKDFNNLFIFSVHYNILDNYYGSSHRKEDYAAWGIEQKDWCECCFIRVRVWQTELIHGNGMLRFHSLIEVELGLRSHLMHIHSYIKLAWYVVNNEHIQQKAMKFKGLQNVYL